MGLEEKIRERDSQVEEGEKTDEQNGWMSSSTTAQTCVCFLGAYKKHYIQKFTITISSNPRRSLLALRVAADQLLLLNKTAFMSFMVRVQGQAEASSYVVSHNQPYKKHILQPV
ncbi:hypothetical protein PGT21_024740 [Puccinia graminis f. sp. tritici]|uniref:Uncharacterized protein n=1 Tax=Puccinia graminis f. sp. tritici TaxID=56615 RepID=A0A5B0P7F6_PUCGR|nr:hypothetical protein PGT21_024740 [Puccinia graminis f. sp. tritici]KAA1131747.1 hypothetical protein PGTUg99_019838 [Puccinia graminis f. sp. tritici]